MKPLPDCGNKQTPFPKNNIVIFQHNGKQKHARAVNSVACCIEINELKIGYTSYFPFGQNIVPQPSRGLTTESDPGLCGVSSLIFSHSMLLSNTIYTSLY